MMIEDADLPPVTMPSCEIRKTLTGRKALITGANSGMNQLLRGREGHVRLAARIQHGPFPAFNVVNITLRMVALRGTRAPSF